MTRIRRPGSRRWTLLAAAGTLGISGLFATDAAANTTRAPGAESRAVGRTARRLGLSADQKEQIHGILESHASEIEAQMRSARSSRETLRETMAAQPLDEARIRQQALALGEVHADGAVLRARIRSEILPILTPEQQEKAAQLRSLRGKREKRRMNALERWLEGGA
jgi:Spy/CpxP family protein refolding chaperone